MQKKLELKKKVVASLNANSNKSQSDGRACITCGCLDTDNAFQWPEKNAKKK